ncbi:hypothetical protein NDI76_15820 [Halogeometricum sp. S1BR25-6]|uniref:HTH luxR-type domain-containing protein n=1 Tax=Halogeometricum salsisoli TaxID=2950536 RepID=A0ABU2GHD7_9EURY|nr:hypothetical protein [Halogeometricum sp. S1BR25-6]MDS0300215.1 hypothetical protein [Halogeometricum sp. S1BR25-6]
MSSEEEISLDSQTAQDQLEILRLVSKGDDVLVRLEDGRRSSGSVIDIVENGSPDGPTEIHVQYLDYGSGPTTNERPSHTVSIARGENGEYSEAQLSCFWTDTGRVRREDLGSVESVWPDYTMLSKRLHLSEREAAFVVLSEMGMSESRIADQWNCDEKDVDFLKITLRRKYETAKETADRLEALVAGVDPISFGPSRRLPTRTSTSRSD